MGHIFRINKQAGHSKNTNVDWSSSSKTPYDHGYVEKMGDKTTKQKEITSIPSPFARIELVKEAFGRIVSASLNELDNDQINDCLHGKTIYHKMVSDSLDVAQIFFYYPTMNEKIEIIVWDREACLSDLKRSSEGQHKILGRSLSMYLEQDGREPDPYNFSKMEKVFILKYVGDGHRSMHIIGATSPASLFFSTANDESKISQYLCLGDDYAFDSHYRSLDQRDPDFVKYLFAYRYSDFDFADNYPEVNQYLDAVYEVLPDNLKKEIDNIQKECSHIAPGMNSFLDSHYQPLIISVSPTEKVTVEVNGKPIYYQSLDPSGQSEFEIVATKEVSDKLPLVLPVSINNRYEKMFYFKGAFGRNIAVPNYDPAPLSNRRLPGINSEYPYLTVSDFLEETIVKLPGELNRADYFDGNYTSRDGKNSGYLLPIKPLYFEYFSIDNLIGSTPSGKKTLEIHQIAGGINVKLRIPVKGGDIEYERNYVLDIRTDAPNNHGAIVETGDNFALGIFPPIKFSDPQDAHYRIALLDDKTNAEHCSCKFLIHDSFVDVDYVVRNVDIEDDLSSKVYFLEGRTFDALRVSVKSDKGKHEKEGTGILIPKFKSKKVSSSMWFAIDFGTSNTHIEYRKDEGDRSQPFEFDKDQPQVSLACCTSETAIDHVRAELVPEAIGKNALCHFPMRTVLCIDQNNSGINGTNKGGYVAMGNASPAFMYNYKNVGEKYNNYVSNLKWGKLDEETEEQIRCFIESIFLLIRNKVIQEGGSISRTRIVWFYPLSMARSKYNLFAKVWNDAFKKYFNSNEVPVAITESIAPYSFFQQDYLQVVDVVTIDIGGGTTDMVVADKDSVRLITSMRFAADAIFGTTLVPTKTSALNGIIKQFKPIFLKKLKEHDNLKKMLEDKTAEDFGSSTEVASFLFSLVDNEEIKSANASSYLDFNSILMKDSSQKIVFYIFYTAIIYHLAKLMKAKELPYPKNIAFSGNGSKVISVLSTDKPSLEKLTRKIFETIYDQDSVKIQLVFNSKNPKEATCKGGLILKKQPEDVLDCKAILLGKDGRTLADEVCYDKVKDEYENVKQEVGDFFDKVLREIPQDGLNLRDLFGIDGEYVELARQVMNASDRVSFIEKGVKIKRDAGEITDSMNVEETLFFYPIIGIINQLSEKIYQRELEKGNIE